MMRFLKVKLDHYRKLFLLSLLFSVSWLCWFFFMDGNSFFLSGLHYKWCMSFLSLSTFNKRLLTQKCSQIKVKLFVSNVNIFY